MLCEGVLYIPQSAREESQVADPTYTRWHGVTSLAVCNATMFVAYFRLDREHIGAVADAVPVDSEFVEDRQQQV